ncbi:hypothetical protein ACHAPJ_006592 [Fusarium lateritium]
MSLGINSVKFEYLHVLMVLQKGDTMRAAVRLEAAREAISLLPSMVSNWVSVYNGIIWHLLYFPFIPFFIVFEHLAKNHTLLSTATIEQDVNLLSIAVSYYSSMRDQLSLLATLCARLEHIAATFLRLARQQVDRRDVLDLQSSQGLYARAQPPSSHDASKEIQAGGSFGGNTTMTFDQMEAELGDEIGADLGSYLEWLPADIVPTQVAHSQDAQVEAGKAAPQAVPENSSGKDPRGTKRPFDIMFDWFAWDVYYAENVSG